ncbi:MAG: magnesium transporter [Verrucomicrobiota bacterium]
MNAPSSQTDLVARQEDEIRALIPKIVERSPNEAAKILVDWPVNSAVSVLEMLNPATRQNLLGALPDDSREEILTAASAENRAQWIRNAAFTEGTVGRLMEPALAIFRPDVTIARAIEELRQLVKRAFITYGFVEDAQGKLLGVVAMRELALGEGNERLEQIMVRKPFFLTPEMSSIDAMRAVVTRHFPVYPVCDAEGKLVGVVRGQTLFEAQAIELSAQAGSMVGVEKEERLVTPWPRSLKFRHPWLQLNLLTAFVAAAVVGIFAHTLERIVLLAVFLPVLAGQSGNTGCQALAVTLRGITLGELRSGRQRYLVAKEALLGLCNGALVGLTAGLGMFAYAHHQHHRSAAMLGFVVFLAMMASCVISGIAGAMVPITLRKLGADPATASSIFLTTATDVVSMGTFLGLASLLIPK